MLERFECSDSFSLNNIKDGVIVGAGECPGLAHRPRILDAHRSPTRVSALPAESLVDRNKQGYRGGR